MDERRQPGIEPDCSAALRELYPFLDGELTVERRTTIRTHLDGCVDCLEVAEFEAELRLVIANRCRCQVPEELRAKVLRALDRTDEV